MMRSVSIRFMVVAPSSTLVGAAPHREDGALLGDDRLVDRDHDRQDVEVGEGVDGRSAAWRRLELGDESGRGRLIERRTAGGIESETAGGAGDDARCFTEARQVEEERIVAQAG